MGHEREAVAHYFFRTRHAAGKKQKQARFAFRKIKKY
jgi:hypothetical protein